MCIGKEKTDPVLNNESISRYDKLKYVLSETETQVTRMSRQNKDGKAGN